MKYTNVNIVNQKAMKDLLRQQINNRAEFAKDRYDEIIKSLHITDTIAGFKARKLAQAYRIYSHYVFLFNGSKQNPTAPYKQREDTVRRRKKNSNFKSKRYKSSQS